MGDSTNIRLSVHEVDKGTVYFLNDETPKVLNLAGTDLAKASTSVQLFWSYPVGLMTLIIETSFTEKKKSYSIRFDHESLALAIKKVYRVLDNEEVEVPITDNDLTFNSDSNYQVIVKLQGPPRMSYYGVFIRYDIIPK